MSGRPTRRSASSSRSSKARPLVADADSAAAVNIRELRRGYDRRVRLPRALVEELARTTSLAQPEWVAARAASDFSRFRPWLEKIVQLKREEAACLAGRAHRRRSSTWRTDAAAGGAGCQPPTAALDLRSSARRIRARRQECRPGCGLPGPPTRARSLGRDHHRGGRRKAAGVCSGRLHPRMPVARRSSSGSYPRERQRIFGETVAAAVGFDFKRGRLDVTAHPFCSGIGPGDCRITTRFDEHHFGDAFFGILHEVGHGLYEQGLDPDALRNADGRGGLAGGARIAIAALGKRRGARPGFLDVLVPHGTAHFSRGARRRDVRGVPRRGQPRRAFLDPGPGRRGDLQPAHHRPLRARAGLDHRRSGRRRPAGGLERQVSRDPGRDASQRRRGMPARHPLERRA